MKKKILIGGCLLIANMSVFAEEPNAMHTILNNGNGMVVPLNEVQNVTFSDSKILILKKDKITIEYPIEEMQKIVFFFEEQTTTPLSIIVPEPTYFKIYGRDILQIECSDGIRFVQLFDMSGRSLFTKETKELPNQTQLNVLGLPAGVFVVRILTTTSIVSQKIVVK